MEKTIVIIMGSAVLPDGRPGPALRRRVNAALKLQGEFEELIFIPSGGIVKNRPCPEAEAMRALLIEAGVNGERIFMEDKSKNTLENVIHSVRIIRQFPATCNVIVCSDDYHILRCRVLLHLMGISTFYRPMPGARKEAGWMRWMYFCVREAVAIPVQVFFLFILKFFRKVQVSHL
ncbi:MAG: YdcF family protein [Desulfobacteraceae bacterium]|jgi:uncharacterized SAM-binding protein YcdF (DUF218 family)